MRAKPLPEQSFLNECFSYDPLTGLLQWKERPLSHFKNEKGRAIANGRCLGATVGALYTNQLGKSYIQVKMGAKVYFAHRLIFKLLYNQEPVEIDHIDGNGCNNRQLNLRASDETDNKRNQRKMKNNSSGITGVAFSGGKYTACVHVNNVKIHLYKGYDFFEACCRRKSANLKYKFHKGHGSERPL